MNDNTKLDHNLKLKLLEAFIFASPEPVKFNLLKQFEDNDYKCPRCNGAMEEYPALSRRDNETDICSGLIPTVIDLEFEIPFTER